MVGARRVHPRLRRRLPPSPIVPKRLDLSCCQSWRGRDQAGARISPHVGDLFLRAVHVNHREDREGLDRQLRMTVDVEPPALGAGVAWGPGADENSQRDMSLVVAARDRIAAETGAIVLLIHHPNKANDVERGSNVLRCAVDTLHRVKRDHGDVVLTCEKQKDAAPFGDLRLRLQPVEVGDGVSSCGVFRKSPAKSTQNRRGCQTGECVRYSTIAGWALGSAVEHRLHTAGVSGSNPLAPTNPTVEKNSTKRSLALISGFRAGFARPSGSSSSA
jgi:AAA domain